MVEEMFRTVKTLLQTRPIFHKCDETIRGHVFCSFLALLLRKELQDRLEAQGDKFEWARVLRDLEALQHTEVESHAKRFLLRSDLADTTAAAFRAAGVAIPRACKKPRSNNSRANDTPPLMPTGAWCQDRIASP